ncbi:MAG: SIMPL domain-containing protein [Parcubacteria group bacterium]|nr:SIMPL domain-containing protein [Parcubacteria group bacterium]
MNEEFFSSSRVLRAISALTLFLVIASLFKVAELRNEWRTYNSISPIRTINIQAEGKVTALPDLATISLSVLTEGKDPKILQQENTAKMNKITEFVKSKNIEEKDIKTTEFNLNPKYQYEANKNPFIIGYELRQTLQVKMRDFGLVGEVVNGAVQNGANQITSLEFTIENQDALKKEARDIAFKKAREKAQVMADAAGVQLGDVMNFSENDFGIPPMVKYFGAEARGLGGGFDATPQIQAGSQEITISANMTFEIR